jgi:uncharacterized membrane protein YphA (DoxX/SURF4 family)
MASTTAPGRTTGKIQLITIVRVLLGLIILFKSVSFIYDNALAVEGITKTGIGIFTKNSEILAMILSYLGLLCGFFITIGLFTRIAAIIQIPVLIVAVFFVNIHSIGDNLAEFMLSMVTLVLLVYFARKGSGPLSADEYLKHEPV